MMQETRKAEEAARLEAEAEKKAAEEAQKKAQEVTAILCNVDDMLICDLVFGSYYVALVCMYGLGAVKAMILSLQNATS